MAGRNWLLSGAYGRLLSAAYLFVPCSYRNGFHHSVEIEAAGILARRELAEALQPVAVVPGFVDCHRHSWEAQLRLINTTKPPMAATCSRRYAWRSTSSAPSHIVAGSRANRTRRSR